ncbi:MAG: DUF1847 domain-containing protein [Desulfarculaceae bacterium]|nr:DUF1847 domain-containing protein [Desulfarculaceae bacterium]
MSQQQEPKHPACAACKIPSHKRVCLVGEGGVGIEGCPSLHQAEALAVANAKYEDPELAEFARQASIQEATAYGNRHARPFVLSPCKSRIQEIWEFAQRMGYKKLGLAFCVGLRREAATVAQILEDKGFEVVSAACKAGATPKEMLGLREQDKIKQGSFETLCNPVFQAELLNQAGCEFNIALGLCVGHDSMFFMNVKAPSTVLAVKDRLLGHNPLAAIYLSDHYYSRLKGPAPEPTDD